MVMGIWHVFEFITCNGEWAIEVSAVVGVRLSKKCAAWTVVKEDLLGVRDD